MVGVHGNGGVLMSLIIKFFREKNALAESGAISLSNLDWGEIGLIGGPGNPNWKIYQNFILTNGRGEYYLSIEALESFRQK